MSNETRRCEWCGDIAQGLCGCPAEIEIAQLRADNATFRNAQRACEHCDPDGHSAAVAAERAITAEAEIERLRAALVECHARPIDRCPCGYPMPCAEKVPITFCRAYRIEQKPTANEGQADRMVRAPHPERAAFEAWWCKAYHQSALRNFTDGCYMDARAGMAWDAWQAAQARLL